MKYTDKKAAVKDWLNHAGWDIIKEEMTQEIDTMTNNLIDDGNINLRFEIKARKSLLNKIEKYDG